MACCCIVYICIVLLKNCEYMHIFEHKFFHNKHLIQFNANVNMGDNQNHTPIFAAVQDGSLECTLIS